MIHKHYCFYLLALLAGFNLKTQAQTCTYLAYDGFNYPANTTGSR